MTALYIIGAGGHAREVASILTQLKNVKIAGYFSDDQPTGRLADEWLGPIADITPEATKNYSKGAFIVAIGDNDIRRRVIMQIEALGLSGYSVISPDIYIDPTIKIEPFTQICRNVSLTCDLHIGKGVIINTGAIISHDAQLGDFAFIGPGATICGNVKIGEEAFIGAGATILPNIIIGDKAVIGAGAVVTQNVSTDAKVMGCPARSK